MIIRTVASSSCTQPGVAGTRLIASRCYSICPSVCLSQCCVFSVNRIRFGASNELFHCCFDHPSDTGCYFSPRRQCISSIHSRPAHNVETCLHYHQVRVSIRPTRHAHRLQPYLYISICLAGGPPVGRMQQQQQQVPARSRALQVAMSLVVLFGEDRPTD